MLRPRVQPPSRPQRLRDALAGLRARQRALGDVEPSSPDECVPYLPAQGGAALRHGLPLVYGGYDRSSDLVQQLRRAYSPTLEMQMLQHGDDSCDELVEGHGVRVLGEHGRDEETAVQLVDLLQS